MAGARDNGGPHTTHARLSVCTSASASCRPGPLLHVLRLRPGLRGEVIAFTWVPRDQASSRRGLGLIGGSTAALGLADLAESDHVLGAECLTVRGQYRSRLCGQPLKQQPSERVNQHCAITGVICATAKRGRLGTAHEQVTTLAGGVVRRQPWRGKRREDMQRREKGGKRREGKSKGRGGQAWESASVRPVGRRGSSEKGRRGPTGWTSPIDDGTMMSWQYYRTPTIGRACDSSWVASPEAEGRGHEGAMEEYSSTKL